MVAGERDGSVNAIGREEVVGEKEWEVWRVQGIRVGVVEVDEVEVEGQ